MRCEKCRSQFTDLHEETLNADERRAMRDHIDTCPDCRDEYAAFCAAVHATSSLPLIKPPERMLKKIDDALDDSQATAVSPLRRLLRLGPVLAAAACFTLVLTGVVTLNRYHTGEAFDLRPPQTMVIPPSVTEHQGSVSRANDVAKSAEEKSETHIQAESASAQRPTEASVPSRGEKRHSGSKADRNSSYQTHPQPVAVRREDDQNTVRIDTGVDEEVLEALKTFEYTPSEVGDYVPSLRMPVTSRGGGEFGTANTSTLASGVETATQTRQSASGWTKSLATTLRGSSCDLQVIPAIYNGVTPAAERLYVHFTPPMVRLVGRPMACELEIISDAPLSDARVLIETKGELELVNNRDGYVYRGGVAAGKPENIEFRIVAHKPGIQRMRVSVETPVEGLRAQMEIVLAGFEVQPPSPSVDPLGKPISVSFFETPLRQALMKVAHDGELSLVIGASVGGDRIRYSTVDTPAGSVLRIIAEEQGYSVEFSDGTYQVCAKD